jgi:uncharacterized membrane protein HdeD (DUF308 family)
VADVALSAMNRVAPWRQGVGWKLVLAEGVIALVVGIAILLQPDAARATLRQILGAALLLSSGLGAGAAFLAFYSGRRQDAGIPLRLFGGGIGVTVGLLVVLEPFLASVGGEAGRSFLVVGLLVYGLLELAAGVAGFGARGLRAGAWLNGALYATFGLLGLVNIRTEVVTIDLYIVVALAVGLLLIGYALILRRARRQPVEQRSTAA